MPWAEWIAWLLTIYASVGVVFAVTFLCAGIGRVDAVAKGSGIGFRLMILPGVVALWPILLNQWIR